MRAALQHGPVVRAHCIKTELVTAAARRKRAERFFTAMQDVPAPSPPILVPLFILLCQQMTLLLRGVGDNKRITTSAVFLVCPRLSSIGQFELANCVLQTAARKLPDGLCAALRAAACAAVHLAVPADDAAAAGCWG